MRLVDSSNMKVSGASEVPQSHGKLVLKEAQLLCFCLKIVSIDVDRNTKYKEKLVRLNFFGKFVQLVGTN